MSDRVPPDPLEALRVVPRALLGTSLALLVVATVFNSTGRSAAFPEALSTAAVAWAVVATVVAVATRGQGLVAPSPPSAESTEEAATRLRRTLVFFAILESGVAVPAVALILCRPQWPLAAALLPLATMALNLPRRAA